MSCAVAGTLIDSAQIGVDDVKDARLDEFETAQIFGPGFDRGLKNEKARARPLREWNDKLVQLQIGDVEVGM